CPVRQLPDSAASSLHRSRSQSTSQVQSQRAKRVLCQAAKKKEMKKPAPAAGPGVSDIAPRCIERGRMVEVKLLGKELPAFIAAKCADERVRVFTGTPTATAVPLVVSAPANLPRGEYAIAASGPDGKEVGRATLRINDIA